MTVCDCLMLHGFLWEQLLLLWLYMKRGSGFPPSGMTGVCCLGGCKIPSCSSIRVPISQLRRLGRRCDCGQPVVGSLPHPPLPALPSSLQDSLRTSSAPGPATPPSPVSTVDHTSGLALACSSVSPILEPVVYHPRPLSPTEALSFALWHTAALFFLPTAERKAVCSGLPKATHIPE